MKNKDFTVYIRIAVFILVAYFLSQNVFNFSFGDEKAEDISIDTSNENSNDLPEIIVKPNSFSEDYLLLLEAYNQAWTNFDIDSELYNEISSNAKALEGLNWLLKEREKSKDIPTELLISLRKYVELNENKEKVVANIFSENEFLSLVREYENGNWILNLKNLSVSKTEEKIGVKDTELD